MSIERITPIATFEIKRLFDFPGLVRQSHQSRLSAQREEAGAAVGTSACLRGGRWYEAENPWGDWVFGGTPACEMLQVCLYTQTILV
jgi:hypothetical protein